MPGTYGSVEGALLYVAVAALLKGNSAERPILMLFATVLSALSILVVAIALRSFRVQDPQEIVLDEVAGQFITLLPLAFIAGRSNSYLPVIAGFVLFRAMDTAKPYPVWKLERLPGAWGVVCDDIGAGLLAAMLLVSLHWLGWKM
jgi:phosphatidylglycerophosphatase A